MTTIGMDYCFMTEDLEFMENPDASIPTATILIIHDDSIDTVWAMQVTRKGVYEEAVKWALQKLTEVGHNGELTIKSDQEESIMALKTAVALGRPSRTALVESKVRVSRSNARVERGVRTWREQFRKLKLHLEAKIDSRIKLDHPMVPWLVEWVGNVI